MTSLSFQYMPAFSSPTQRNPHLWLIFISVCLVKVIYFLSFSLSPFYQHMWFANNRTEHQQAQIIMIWHINRWCLESKHLQAICTTVNPVTELETSNNLSQNICTTNCLAEAYRLKIINIFHLTCQLWSPGGGCLECCAEKKCETIQTLTRKEYHDWVDRAMALGVKCWETFKIVFFPELSRSYR